MPAAESCKCDVRSGAYWGVSHWISVGRYIEGGTADFINPQFEYVVSASNSFEYDYPVDLPPDVAAVSEDQLYAIQAIKTPGKLAPYAKTIGQTAVGSYPPGRAPGFSVNLTDPRYMPTQNVLVGGEAAQFDTEAVEADRYFSGSVATYVNGDQRWIHYHSVLDSARETNEITTVDIREQTRTEHVETAGALLWRRVVQTYQIDARLLHNYARCNLGFGRTLVTATTYDDSDNLDIPRIWEASRSVYGGGYAVADDVGFDLTKLNVVRPAFHVYLDSDEDDDEAWVMAYSQFSRRWVVGVWKNNHWKTTQAAQGPPPHDPTLVGWLHDGTEAVGDVNENGLPVSTVESEVRLTIQNGSPMSTYARCLCFQRIRGRVLAVFWDEDQTLLAALPECPDGDGRTALGKRIFRSYLYDSARATPLIEYKSYTVCVYDSAEVDPCFPENVDHNGDFLENPADMDGAPTFITVTRDDDVVIGSPKFVRMFNGQAVDQAAAYKWEIIARDFEPLITLTGGAGACYDAQGEAVRVLSETGNLDGTKQVFGKIDYRNFAILPTSGGLQLRGFQGVLEMASAEQLGTFDGYTYRRSLPIGGDEVTQQDQFQYWITDWTIGLEVADDDGLPIRVPHWEPYNLTATVMSEAQYRHTFRFESAAAAWPFSGHLSFLDPDYQATIGSPPPAAYLNKTLEAGPRTVMDQPASLWAARALRADGGPYHVSPYFSYTIAYPGGGVPIQSRVVAAAASQDPDNPSPLLYGPASGFTDSGSGITTPPYTQFWEAVDEGDAAKEHPIDAY